MDFLLACVVACGLGLAIFLANAYRFFRAAVGDEVQLAGMRRRKAVAELVAEAASR